MNRGCPDEELGLKMSQNGAKTVAKLLLKNVSRLIIELNSGQKIDQNNWTKIYEIRKPKTGHEML